MNQSPCIGCPKEKESKRSFPGCIECQKKGIPVKYVLSMGNMTHSLPIHKTHAGRNLDGGRIDEYVPPKKNDRIKNEILLFKEKEAKELEKTVEQIVTEICEKHGVARDRLPLLTNKKKTTTKLRFEIIRAVKDMTKREQLSQILGVSKPTLYYYFDKIAAEPIPEEENTPDKVINLAPAPKEGIVDLNKYPELLERLKKIAAKEMRSLDKQLIYLLTQATTYYQMR